MSRSGYHDDLDDEWALIRWRGAVASAIKGKRGQAFLREMIAALDALPEKCLVSQELATPAGEVCAMGAVCRARGVDVSEVDPDDYSTVAGVMGLSEAMVREIANENDERCLTPEQRWESMRKWAVAQLVPDPKTVAAEEPKP